MRNMIIKRHYTASVLIVQALQKGPCGANQIAYTDVGSADTLSEQGLDLRNTANKTTPSWLLPKLTAHALKASSRPVVACVILQCIPCFYECRCMSDGVFIQFVCQLFNLMAIQMEVCQRLVCMVFVNSPHYSNEDHMEHAWILTSVYFVMLCRTD